MTLHDEATPSFSAKDIRAEAAKWIERQDRRDWNERDQVLLDAWLAQSSAHFLAYHRMASVWNRADRLAALRRPQTPSRTLATPNRKPFRAAAAVATVLAIGSAAYIFNTPGTRTFSTPVGGHEIVTLRDGSSIELNTDTVVRTRLANGRREAVLERGEAYFQIAHDRAHPFHVGVGSRQITVLGTKFSVRREPDAVRVALFEGSIRFAGKPDEASDGKSAFLAPGDVLVASANMLTVSHKPTLALIKTLSWRKGYLAFDHTALGDVAHEFNRYNRERIVISDPAAARMTMSGRMPTNDISEFIRIAKSVFDLHVRKNGNDIVISR